MTKKLIWLGILIGTFLLLGCKSVPKVDYAREHMKNRCQILNSE
jgi:hypothetical protein